MVYPSKKDVTFYETKCVFCGRKIKTLKGSANEGICITCREV